MKTLQTVFACLSVLLVVACSNEELSENATPEFKIVSSITPVTRTPQLNSDGSGRFEKGDVNTLFFHDKEELLHTFDYSNGQRYYWSDLNLPATLTHCYLSATYPQVSTSTPSHFSWDVLKNYPTSDFLVAIPVEININSGSPIRLSFSHVLHRLSVELTSGEPNVTDDILQQGEIVVRHFQPVAILDLLAGKAVSASGNLAELNANGKQTTFIIPAQNVGSAEVVIRLNERQHVFRLADLQLNGMDLKNLESGKTLTLKIKVSKSSFTIVGQTISGWGSQGEFEDSIII